jgi:hypothetical protein
MVNRNKSNNAFGSAYGKANNNACRVGGQQKTKKKRRRRRRGRAAKGSLNTLALNKKLCDAVCSQYDPFCNNCLTGLFDSNTSKVVRLNLRKFVTVSLNATGFYAVKLQPSWAAGVSVPGGMTSDQVTSWITEDFPYYDIDTFSHYRIISMGMRFVSSAPPSSAAGFVHGAVADDDELIHVDNMHLYKDNHTARIYQGDFAWVARPKGPESHAFTPIGDLASAWEYGYFGWSGTDSQNIGRVEFVMNVEALPRMQNSATTTSLIPLLAHEAAPSIPQITDMANNAQTNSPPFHDNTSNGKSTSSSIMDVVEDVVAQGIATYGPQVLEGIAAFVL